VNFRNKVKIKNKPNAAGASVKAVMFAEQKDEAKILAQTVRLSFGVNCSLYVLTTP
jgi:hypothetical protein